MIKRWIALALWSAIAAWWPTQARAGSYEVYSCADAPDDVNHAWTSTNTDPSHLEQGGSCAVPSQPDEQQLETSGLFSADQLGLSSGSPPGSTASWNLHAPPGTTITHLTYHRHLGKNLDDDWKPRLVADGATVPGETCSIVGSASGCVVDGFAQLDLNAQTLALGVTCGATSGVCDTGSSIHDVFAALYSSTITISDPVAPTLGNLSGSLLSNPPPAFHSATDSETVPATDNVGIRGTTVYVDGHAVSTVPNPCDYTFVVPCLHQPGAVHTIDWRSLNLPDGPHQVQAAATDAAGNETRSAPATILVDTHPPGPPAGLPATTTQTRPAFTLAWTNPPQGQGAPIARADYLACPTAGVLTCTAGHSIGTAIHQLTLTAPAHGRWRVAVWLTDAAGNGAIADAAATEVAYLQPAGLRIARPAFTPDHRRLIVAGTAALPAGDLTISLRVRVNRTKRRVHTTAMIRHGRFRAGLRFPPGATLLPGARVVVAFAGDQAHAPATITRHP